MAPIWLKCFCTKGYEVHGLIRRASTFNTRRIDHIYKDPHGNGHKVKLFLHYGDVTAPDSLLDVIYNVKPDEVYHLAAQSHVRVSFDMPEYTGDVTALGTVRILEAIRKAGMKSRFYQASSSELFGSSKPRKVRKHLSVPAAPTLPPSSTLIGSPITTVKAMACTPSMGSFSTMSHLAAVRPS